MWSVTFLLECCAETANGVATRTRAASAALNRILFMSAILPPGPGDYVEGVSLDDIG